MIRFTNTIEIEKPTEDVFAFFSMLENMPKWNYYIQKVENLTPEITGVGAHYHQVRKTDEQFYAIEQFEENKLIVVASDPEEKASFKRNTSFEAKGNSTVLTDLFEINTKAPFFIEKLFAKKPKKAVLENLHKLKELLEKGQVVLQDGQEVLLK